MIPASSTRGRKRPRPGEAGQREDKRAVEMLNAFKARLDSVREVDPVDGRDADKASSTIATESRRLDGLTIASPAGPTTTDPPTPAAAEEEETEETPLCDLHFIAHCQSCSKWDEDLLLLESSNNNPTPANPEEDSTWMSHRLAFGKDTLGKDLNFKKRQAALEELVVIDPREKAGVLLAAERERVRARKEELRARGR
jgi:peptidyl-prolyl cis-trans isomerase SDCCAG10